ncbi:MAG: hypothetical protein AABZ39_16465 [Spirochaetota bacterium]
MADDIAAKVKALEAELVEKTRYIKYLENLSEAHEHVITLAQEERIEAEKVIHAHETIHGVGALFDGHADDKTIRAMKEQKIVINQSLHAILEHGVDLEEVIRGLMALLKMERAVLFLSRGEKRLGATANVRMTAEEMKKPYFEMPSQIIRAVAKLNKTIIVKNKKITVDGAEKPLSIVCIPFMYGDNPIGVLYLDVISHPL